MAEDSERQRTYSAPGPTSRTVGENLARLRDIRNLSTNKLARMLKEAGVPMPASAITRVEKGKRRVTTDELMALAMALGATPNALLLPSTTEGSSSVTGHDKPLKRLVLWAWADGLRPLTTGADRRKAMADFELHARPKGPDPVQIVAGSTLR